MPSLDDSPQARRKARVEGRLREALAELEADPQAVITPSVLARLAGVSRNTLYHHTGVLDAARAAARKRAPKPSKLPAPTTESIGQQLEQQVRQLVTQNAGLLQRAMAAERRAAQLEARNAELVRALDALRKPTIVNPGRG